MVWQLQKPFCYSLSSSSSRCFLRLRPSCTAQSNMHSLAAAKLQNPSLSHLTPCLSCSLSVSLRCCACRCRFALRTLNSCLALRLAGITDSCNFALILLMHKSPKTSTRALISQFEKERTLEES